MEVKKYLLLFIPLLFPWVVLTFVLPLLFHFFISTGKFLSGVLSQIIPFTSSVIAFVFFLFSWYKISVWVYYKELEP